MTLLLSNPSQKKEQRQAKVSNYPKNLNRILLYVFLVFILFLLLLNNYVFISSRQYIIYSGTGNFKNETSPIVGIVLGGSVKRNGDLSVIVEDRANTAVSLYFNGKIKKILVTGDNRTRQYNEVIPIRSFLINAGVKPEDVFTDYAGFDTYDSMYRAKNIFDVENAYIITQRFHLPRALYAALHMGINSYGIPADKRSYQIKNDIRELFATVKTFFEVQTRAKSLILGDKIPITGDGRSSL